MKSLIDQYCSTEWKEFVDFHKEVKTFKEGEYIFEVEEDTKGLYIIDEGKVKISYQQYDGSQRLIKLATDGDILGHRGFGGNWVYPISALTLADTKVSFIPVKIFDTLVKANAEFCYHFMMFFADELRKSEAKIKHYPVKNLVAKVILDNYRVFGFDEGDQTKLSYTLSRKDIASKAGTTYETVVRTLAEFNKKEIIKIDGKTIHILNMDDLKDIADPQYKKV